jgi:hypothetical protein
VFRGFSGTGAMDLPVGECGNQQRERSEHHDLQARRSHSKHICILSFMAINHINTLIAILSFFFLYPR